LIIVCNLFVTQVKNISYCKERIYEDSLNELSFPFDGARGFGADVIDHPVDSMYFIDDAV